MYHGKYWEQQTRPATGDARVISAVPADSVTDRPQTQPEMLPCALETQQCHFQEALSKAQPLESPQPFTMIVKSRTPPGCPPAETGLNQLLNVECGMEHRDRWASSKNSGDGRSAQARVGLKAVSKGRGSQQPSPSGSAVPCPPGEKEGAAGWGQQLCRVLGQRPRHLTTDRSMCRTSKHDLFSCLCSPLTGAV